MARQFTRGHIVPNRTETIEPGNPAAARVEIRDDEDLDPEDWEALRSLGHRMVDDAVGWLATVRERPTWRRTPEGFDQRFRRPLPREPRGAHAAYASFLEDVRPWPLGNVGPRWWGWVAGNGTPFAMLADMLASGLNVSVGGFDHAAYHVEEQVLAWLREMLGHRGSGGILTTGASMASFVGLCTARNAALGEHARTRGVAAAGRTLVAYGSRETHSSIPKALDLLGLGSESFRALPADGEGRVDLAALRVAIEDDRAGGREPFCVVGNAGTVNTGAIDDLAALADLAEEHGLWFHVDGAFGAFGWLDAATRPRLAGMERADSLAFDLHKWMHMPYDLGCVLLRSEQEQRDSFATSPAYLVRMPGGPSRREKWFGDYGPELSRGFRAPKVWLSLIEHGADRFGRMVSKNIAQARHLAERVEREPALELLAPASLNVVCFRHRYPGAPLDEANRLNRDLLVRIQESGVAVPSHTVLDGVFAIRVCITNHRTRRGDLDQFLDAVLEEGARPSPRDAEATP